MITGKITPDWIPHKQLSGSVNEWLSQHGFMVESLTYHDKLSPELARILSSRYSWTAQYLRGRSDHVAIHGSLPIEFEFEIKTAGSRSHRNIAVEALPLAHHLVKSFLGVRCLYVYRNPYNGTDVGFWADFSFPPISALCIPERWDQRRAEEYRQQLESLFRYFPFGRDMAVKYPEVHGGSGDPFVVIDVAEIPRCRHWQDIIGELIGGCTGCHDPSRSN